MEKGWGGDLLFTLFSFTWVIDMQDRTASQRWASSDMRPGSTFHEIVAIPTLLPGAAHPYQLPGMQLGASSLDQFPWAQAFLQNMRSNQDPQPSPSKPGHQSTRSPSVPTQHTEEPEQIVTLPPSQDVPPLSGDSPTQLEPPTVEPQQSQQPLASDSSSKIIRSCVSARDIYGYKISLSYNFSSSYPHSFHSIPFESRLLQARNRLLIVCAGKIRDRWKRITILSNQSTLHRQTNHSWSSGSAGSGTPLKCEISS